MKFSKVYAAYFSATGTTQKVVTAVAEQLAKKFDVNVETFDFTLPGVRAEVKEFESDALVVFGTPVIAGRVPNVLLKYLATVKGNGAVAVPVVLYGNRNFDDALIELRDILEADGLKPVAAAAFIGEHSFSKILAANRPDDKDMAIAAEFADKVAAKLEAIEEVTEIIAVEGVEKPYRGYYQPRDRQGTPVNILKVKPLTNEKCINCGLCARVCPMGSINPENVKEITGICIKCCACVKKCPMGAKYYEDGGYLYHKTELEEGYKRRAEPALFI